MYFLGKFTIIDWYGFDNPNSCLISYFNPHGNGENRNLGFVFMPLHFWKHFHISDEVFGHNNKRFRVGVGLITFFIDH